MQAVDVKAGFGLVVFVQPIGQGVQIKFVHCAVTSDK
jgi:hypothetical protein